MLFRSTSPPPMENFHEIPVVTWEAYDYDGHTEEEAQADREEMPGAGAAVRQEAARDSEEGHPVGHPSAD